MINSLQALRFFLALMIFHHHFFFNPQIEQFGTFPVAFFFVLSGFLLSVGYAEKLKNPSFSYRKFVVKRFSRVYPLNFIGIVLFLVFPLILDIHSGSIRVLKDTILLPDILLLQSWFPFPHIYHSFNAPCWFLSDIVFCYLMFPLLLRARKGIKPSLYMILLLVLYFGVVSLMPENWVHPLIYINPLFRLIDFMLGVELYFYYIKLSKNQYGNIPFLHKSIVEVLVFFIAFLALVAYDLVPHRYSYASFYWIPSMLIILSFSLFADSGGAISHFLNNRFLVYLGTLSFPFYVFHFVVIRWYWEVKNILGVSNIIGGCLCVVFTLLMSHAFIRYLEPPIKRQLKTLYE